MRARASRLFALAILAFLAETLFPGHALAVKPWKARGRKAYKVYIDSAPQQAAVYVNDKKHGIFCYTPCNRVRLPYKTVYKLIFVKDGYKEKTVSLRVTRHYWRRFDVKAVLEREIQPGIIDVQSDASGNATGAIIYVNGKQRGTVPNKVKVKPGRHQVRVEKAGFTTHTQWVTVSEKQIWTFQAVLKPKAKPKGTLLVAADISGAEVLVDGKSHGNAPVVVKDLEAGPHTVEVRKEGAATWKQVVVVESGKIRKVTAEIGASVPKHGTLRVVSNVPGAEVFVDGEKKGVAPLTVPNLIPGDHIVLVQAKGYEPKQVPFKIQVDQQSLVTVDLERIKEEAPVGTIRIQADQADAMVILDGQRIGKAPVERSNVPAGSHIVKVQKDGYLTHTEKITVEKGKTYTITAELKAAGELKVTSSPSGATVFVDTKPVGKTPITDYILKEGTYTVEMELQGYHPEQKKITVKGGEPVAIHMDLELIRTGPTPEETQRGLNSFGALAVPPGRFTADVTTGFLPYYSRLRLTVGAYRGKYFGVDAGISIWVQGVINVFTAHGRFQLYRAGPFTVGAFTEIGGGPGYQGRSAFLWNIGAVASLSFRNLITVSLRMYGKIFWERFCRSDAADPNLGESEPHWCALLDDPATSEDELANVPLMWREDLRSNHRKGFWGARFLMSLFIEVAVTKYISVHGELTGAPGMEQRAMWHDYFNSPMLSSVNGGDPRIYGGAGVTFKF